MKLITYVMNHKSSTKEVELKWEKFAMSNLSWSGSWRSLDKHKSEDGVETDLVY